MQVPKRVQRWALEIALVLFAVWAIAAFQARNLPSGAVPSFSLQTLDGATIDNTDLRGKPTMLVFWAPWCGVCRAASQNVSWVQALSGQNARVLSVASHYDDVAEVHDYVRQHGVDYPVLLGGRDAERAFGVHVYPTVFFLDAQGAIRRSVIGYTSTLGMWLRL